MNPKIWMMVAALWLGGCTVPDQPASRQQGAVAIELVDLSLRQYHRANLRFEFHASRLVLDEDGQVMQASGGVAASLQPGMWKRGQ